MNKYQALDEGGGNELSTSIAKCCSRCDLVPSNSVETSINQSIFNVSGTIVRVLSIDLL